jgi:hypothetical protein
MCYLDTFLSAPASHRIWSTQSVRDNLQNQIMFVVICLIVFGAHMNILYIGPPIIYRSSYTGPPIMLIIEPRMVSIFWACIPISCKHISLRCPFLEPHLTSYHSHMGFQIIAVSGIRHVYLNSPPSHCTSNFIWCSESLMWLTKCM